MTKEQFQKKWRNHLAGLALFGMASEVKDGTLARAARALEIPAEVERILGLMYADLATEEQPTNRLNGNGRGY